MAHCGQERGFCDVGLVGNFQRVFELFVFGKLRTLNFRGVAFEQDIKFRLAVDEIIDEPFVENFAVHVAVNVDFVRLANFQSLFDFLQAQRLKKFFAFFGGTVQYGRDLMIDIIFVVAVEFMREDTAARNFISVADDDAVIAADNVSYHVVLVGKSLAQNGVADNFGVVVLLGGKGKNIAGIGVAAHGDFVVDETFAPVGSAAE